MSTKRPTIALAPPALRSPEPELEAGFVSDPVSPSLARRQLHVSFGVLGVFVAAAGLIAATFGLPSARAPERAVTTVTVQQPQFVRPMTAGHDGGRAAFPTGG